MRTTIDGAGRVVIPKALRDRMGLAAGSELEIEERDGRLHIEPAGTVMHLEERDGMVSAVPEGDVPPLTTDLVRDTIERVRR